MDRLQILALNYNIMRIANTADFVCNYPHHVDSCTSLRVVCAVFRVALRIWYGTTGARETKGVRDVYAITAGTNQST